MQAHLRYPHTEGKHMMLLHRQNQRAQDRVSSKDAMPCESEEHLLQKLLDHIFYGDDPQRLCRRKLSIRVPRPHGVLQSATAHSHFSFPANAKAGHQ